MSRARRAVNLRQLCQIATPASVVRSFRGGNLLYRWGNPAAYKSGTAADQRLFYQHDPQWIAPGLPGAGNMLVFNNGWNPNPKLPSFSTVEEITLPAKAQQWYVGDSQSPSITAAKQFNTGIVPASWVPLAGDWDGDGRDSVGYYDPTNRRFLLYAATTTAVAPQITIDAGLAAAGWIPLVGDWNGDGTDTVGLFDAATRTFFMNNRVDGSITALLTVRPAFVERGWRPIAGDWNGDGRDTYGLFNPGFAAEGYAKSGRAYGPTASTWRYVATPRKQFYARIISGMQRLPNGNTLINEGTKGRFFEVTPAGKIVWEYINPVIGPSPADVLSRTQPAALATAIQIPGVYQNLVFRAYRYAANHPGLAGRDLTPGQPLERLS